MNSDTTETNEIPLNPFKIKGELFNTHQNSSRNHQESSTISQNHFLIHFATKSSTNPKGTASRHPGALIEAQSPSEGITYKYAGPVEISRFGHTPQPPTSNDFVVNEWHSSVIHNLPAN